MIDKMKRQTIKDTASTRQYCRQISRLLSISRNTVANILNEEEESSQPGVHQNK